MTQTRPPSIDLKPALLADFQRFMQSHPAAAWMAEARKRAADRFGDLGFPTPRDEDWRYTDLAPQLSHSFSALAGAAGNPSASDLRGCAAWDIEACRLTFVDGVCSPVLSTLDRLPEGVCLMSLADAMKQNARVVLEEHLARHAAFNDHALVALNTAFFGDGALVHIPRGRIIETPIHLVFLTTRPSAPRLISPRVLIVAERESQAAIVETYAGPDGAPYFTNGVTEIVAGENAVLDHYKVQREGNLALHTWRLRLQQQRNSNVSSHNSTFGGRLTRNDVHTVLDGEGCDCHLNGLYVLKADQHVDNHLRVEHAKPHCDSREYYKGVLDERSHGVFCGRILVHKDAQKTDAKQTNMNLILSSEALVDTKPQLEIFADDVKCTHGATIGQIDADALFYMRSRGIHAEAARSLLIYAFASESLEQIKIGSLADDLHHLLFDRLPHGDLLREAP